MVDITLIIGGVVVNVLLLIVYIALHMQTNKIHPVREHIIRVVKRARTSYLLHYIGIVAIFFGAYLTEGNIRFILLFLAIALLILLETFHDRERLVLTDHQAVIVKGFLKTKAKMVEYKDIVLVEIQTRVIGQILGYGDISLTLYGSQKIFFKKIPHLLKVKDIIEERKIDQEGR